ncbi:hypothetical protein [Corynebacterium halotolerans]|uniref:Cutinase n=1 Tax=Corynebacterium halotolerans YIM 70093 = DSM 44683 TaxID=1121362 RepID=M1NUL0_9CORY|nr:hypothetical protein [Corynebacterium halotolerans]AGF73182.1 hypothetical protein A605_10910 [Corynebacterium halotolerans YIM 70093 = DSM 44683]
MSPSLAAVVGAALLTLAGAPSAGASPADASAGAAVGADPAVDALDTVVDAFATPAGERCPEVVVLAARGSEQNSGLEPTRYSEQAPWVSNGFEGPNLRAFLQFAEQRHLEHTGESLLAEVPVLALNADVYPAALPLPALAEQGEELNPVETARRLGGVLEETPAHVIAGQALHAFRASVEGAAAGVGGVLADFEAASGCEPGYLLLGYSQGAIVLTLQEQWLHDAGRLAGAVYLGNPLLAPGDPGTVTGPVRGGALRAVPPGLRPGAEVPNRLNYCLPGDFTCDVDLDSLGTALTSHGGPHTRYFLVEPASPWDAAVADQFAAWVTGYTSHP